MADAPGLPVSEKNYRGYSRSPSSQLLNSWRYFKSYYFFAWVDFLEACSKLIGNHL